LVFNDTVFLDLLFELFCKYNSGLKKLLMETSCAVTSRAGEKTKSLGLDWPNAEDTRQIPALEQNPHRVKPTGEAQERSRPQHTLTTGHTKECKVGGETVQSW